MLITVQQYWMGRDSIFGGELTDDVRANAEETVRRVNVILELANAAGVPVALDQVTRNRVSSGWRPAGVNARTANAGAKSTHITGEGCDIQDNAGRELARWCLRNLTILEEVGLWMEDPQWTGGLDPWVHLQTRGPRSGKRVYVPSAAAPIASKLPEQEALA